MLILTICRILAQYKERVPLRKLFIGTCAFSWRAEECPSIDVESGTAEGGNCLTEEENKCPYCGNTELKKYEDKDVQYVYCTNCDKQVDLNDFVKRSESDFICDNCGAKVLEEDDKCLQCGEPLYEDEEYK